ncbi:MAG: CYTH domain-containing protein [Crocinitomicaceae bacterium]|jgi:CYTH domain-containing protein|tara:strand:- start:24723 stop:25178 length:456 start_codon:yes stop_codon:yes gene_type:complete
MLEIERKFLIVETLWDKQVKNGYAEITQGYVLNSIEKSVRIRINDDRAFLTIKGPTKGISRAEYEYEIPKIEGEEMILSLSLKVLKKRRYEILFEGKVWEVDVFKNELEGLILAEIELESEDEKIILPNWVGEEVSYDAQYYNTNLINRLS